MPFDQRLDKENVVHLHNGVVHSRKKNDILRFSGKWMGLENILSEVTQTQKDSYYMDSLIGGFLNIKQRKPAYKP